MIPEDVVQAVVELSEGMSRPVYRGQAKARWKLQSGALRRLQDAFGEDFPEDENELRKLVDRYHKEQLIMPMEVMDGATLSDLQRLSVLQHQGAATGLLDFTEYPLVALWFACAEWSEKDGKVFVLDIGNPQVAQNARLMTDPFSTEQVVVYYEPDRSLGARIIAQQGVFVICNRHVPEQYLKSVTVPWKSKARLRGYLKGLGLSEVMLFGDIPGLAAANTADKSCNSHLRFRQNSIAIEETGPIKRVGSTTLLQRTSPTRQRCRTWRSQVALKEMRLPR